MIAEKTIDNVFEKTTTGNFYISLDLAKNAIHGRLFFARFCDEMKTVSVGNATRSQMYIRVGMLPRQNQSERMVDIESRTYLHVN